MINLAVVIGARKTPLHSFTEKVSFLKNIWQEA